MQRIFALILACAVSPGIAFGAEQTLIADFEQPIEESDFKMTTRDASAKVVEVDGGHAVEVTLGNNVDWPNVRFLGRWDLSQHTHLLADLTNLSDETIRLVSKVTYQGGPQRENVGERMALDPGESATMRIHLSRHAPPGHEFLWAFEGMDVMPAGHSQGSTIDPSRINMIEFFGFKPTRPQTFRVTNIRAVGTYQPPTNLPSEDEFFPFIDKFGQYIHQDWPTKVRNDAEFEQQIKDEREDLARHPRPDGWDERGGWAAGPTLEATGAWRTHKHDGKWWLVTPEGRLFWSLGVDVVQPQQETRIAPDRDNWFADLPLDDPQFEPMVRVRTNVRNQNAGVEQTVFDFYAANMVRKFGSGWERGFADLAHQRLPSWGFNTIGLWAKGPVIDNPPMPYVHWAYYMSPRIKVWGPNLPKWFPDVYHPDFKKNIHSYAQRMLADHAADPNLIGLFIDNELPWGSETTMGELAILAPADTPHAQALVEFLQERHGGDIAGVNAAWGTDFADWDAFAKLDKVPVGDAVTTDLRDFSEQTMRIYFETARDVVRTHAPGKLYLGCRFAEHYVNPLVVKISAEYSDVVSFNVYRESIAHWQPPADIDKPIMIGEFHFGAPDRGVFGSGLVPVASQEERAEAIKRYVRGAAQNPLIVGAHWFQYIDQVTTGRPLDRENHQIGLVNIADVPHADTIEAFREVGDELYQLRGE